MSEPTQEEKDIEKRELELIEIAAKTRKLNEDK